MPVDKAGRARAGILAASVAATRCMISRRRLLRLTALTSAGALLPSCGASGFDEAARQTWRHATQVPDQPVALLRELVRYATLAANSHNTQPWRFALDAGASAIAIQPDPHKRLVLKETFDSTLDENLQRIGETRTLVN